MRVHAFASRAEMAQAAADRLAREIRRLTRERERVAGLFASAPSQTDTLAALVEQPGIDWQRVTVFHLDEYLGFSEDHPQSFRRYLRERLVDRVSPAAFHGLRGEAADPEKECARYAALLEEQPPQFALIGIGENGHLAFNDPWVADFQDPAAVKIVELDEKCRLQQVHDGLFPSLDQVPSRALTLTLPAILRTPRIFAVVPGPRKREAVGAALYGPVSTSCPASILRTHPAAELFLDRDSAPSELQTRPGTGPQA